MYITHIWPAFRGLQGTAFDTQSYLDSFIYTSRADYSSYSIYQFQVHSGIRYLFNVQFFFILQAFCQLVGQIMIRYIVGRDRISPPLPHLYLTLLLESWEKPFLKLIQVGTNRISPSVLPGSLVHIHSLCSPGSAISGWIPLCLIWSLL